MLAFALAVTLLLITPGPGVLSIAGVGAAFGTAAGLRDVAIILLPMLGVLLVVILSPDLILALPRWLMPRFV